MRGKNTTLAIIVFMLIAGGVMMYFVPDYDSTGDDQQAQTELTPTAVK